MISTLTRVQMFIMISLNNGYSLGGGVLGYDLGGYVPPRFPNLDPVLKKIFIYFLNKTPF